MAKPKKPANLNAAGSSLWSEISETYELRRDELHTLESACRAADRIALMRDELGKSPLMVKGSMGQDVVHPLVAELRAHESQVAGLLAKLKLPDEADSEAAAGERSSRARAAANARWSTRGA